MIYLIFLCLSINWLLISASDVADGKLQTLSALSETLQKDTRRSNPENLHSRLLDKEFEYVEHSRAKATKELSGLTSKSHIEEESDNKSKDGNKGTSGDAGVVDTINGPTKHTGVVRSSGVKEIYRSDYVKLGKTHDQSSARSYTTLSDSAVSKYSDKDNEGPLAGGDDDVFAEQTEPLYTFSDIKFIRAPQWDLKNNIKVLNLDTGSVRKNTIARYDELSRNTEGEDVRFRDLTVVKEIPLDVLSASLDRGHQQNPIYSVRRKPISRISELHRSIMPPANFKQTEGEFGGFGPNSVAGSNLYGSYASAHSSSYPYGGLGFNEGFFMFGEGGEGELES